MHAAIGLAQILDRQQCGDNAHSATSIREVTSVDFGSEDRRRFLIASSVPTIPLGKATTISTMKPPSTSFERSVWLTSQILAALKTMAPTTAPETVSTPLSITMTHWNAIDQTICANANVSIAK